MKIISIDTNALKEILNNGNNYRYLYGIFEKYYKSDLRLPEWHDNLTEEATERYVVNNEVHMKLKS